MNVTPSQLNAVIRTLREVGYTGLDEAEAQIVQAFNDGDLQVSEEAQDAPNADREYHNKCLAADFELERGGSSSSWAREVYGEPFRETE